MYSQGRPVLVGTTRQALSAIFVRQVFSQQRKPTVVLLVYCDFSVEQSEYLSALLQEWMVPHNVLNARPKVLAADND